MGKPFAPTLEELASIGEEVQRNGFTVDRLHRATTLFYEKILKQLGFEFEPDQVQVVEYEVVVASSKDQEKRAFKELWNDLPPSIRSRISPQTLWKLCYSRTGYGLQSHLLDAGSALVGNYHAHRDICYIADAIPNPADPTQEFVVPEDDKLCIGAHELTHRYLHLRKLGLTDPKVRLGLIGPEEENFCTSVGDLFEGCVFPEDSGRLTSRELRQIQKRLARRARNLLDPGHIKSYTTAVINAFSQLGQSYLEKRERQKEGARS